MAQQWALVGNLLIAVSYAAITMAILVPVVRAGQLRTNRLAVATALIFFSCAVGHAFHAAQYWEAALGAGAMAGMHTAGGGSMWPAAAWDLFTAAVGAYYWTLRRHYGVLLGGTGALYVDAGEQQRRHDIELRERVAAGRAKAEAERDAHAAMLDAVITNSRSAVYVKDLDGRYLLANREFLTAFGVSEDDLLGRTDEYLDPVRAAQWRANDLRARQGPVRLPETAEFDGDVRVYDTTKFPLYDADGELYAICGISLDVTDLRRATENAVQARDEAIAQSRIKSEFLATMSHEIRTPMNGVLGLAGLLMSTNLDPAQRRYAAGIHQAGNALLGVINDILDFSKLEAGKIVLDPADFDVYAVLTETAALVTPAADDKGLVVTTRRGPDLPTTVHGDAGRLRQILLNLAGNAVKFTGKGSVTLRADLLPTRPGSDAVVIRFQVIDTGIGITATDAGRLFEPFTQADASTTRTYGGTGLGLAISRQLTEAMGGTIGVDSEPGQGSTFHCEIPFEAARGTPATDLPAGSGLRILVAGTGADRDTLTADLRRWQMTVTTADTSTAALTALREAAAHGRPYDLLLLDADPGDIDTAALAHRVTDDATIPAAHIVILNETAPGTAGTVGTYLPKPVHRSALYNVLAQSMAAATPAARAQDPAPPPGRTDRGTVLLVEDNDINQMVAAGILTGFGFRTDIAADGVEACEMAAAHDYDVILMDCRMPRMDGFTATAELRRREAGTGRHTPIIAMTASALVADRDRCLAAGMDDYLSKPVDPAELDTALIRWTTGSRTAGPARPDAPPSAAPDPIGDRLDELAGDRTPAETGLVDRLVASFLTRAPRHLDAIVEAYQAGDARTVEDQAHILRGAAGNIGAATVMAVCERVEDAARAGQLSEDVGDDLRRLDTELGHTEHRLRVFQTT